MGKTKGKVKEMKKLKSIKENWDKTTQSADKKPEKYIKPDGKVGIRMVPVKKGLQTYKKKPMDEKTLTPAEKKKREEIAKAMEKDNPGMDMKKKMAIATWQAKRVAEGAKLVEAQDPEMEKVKQLVRLGLMDKKDMSKIVRALTLMKDGKPVPQKERKILFDMLGELMGMITGDDAMFNKARKAVREEKDMNDMCCKHCGDEFGKPKSESCMYDAYDMAGRNWCSKKEYLSSQNMKNEVLDTPKAMQSYRDKAKYSKDRAANSAGAKMLRSKDGFKSTDTSDELKTMDKRSKGLKMADRNATKKTFKALRKEQVGVDEAARRKGAPKMTGDSIAIQRAKDAEHAKAMGRSVKTGRKLPKKTMTSTQRSLASLRGEGLDETLSPSEKKLVNQMYDKKGNLTPMGKKVMNHGKKPGDKGFMEALERDGPKKPDGLKPSFGKAASASPAVQKYMTKRAAGNQARNKAMDPGAAKKGYGIGVTDIDKADKKAKAKGTSIMKRMASKGKNYKAGKMM